MDSSRKEIGKRLKRAREKAGLTQADLAKGSGIHINYYARIERGEVNPSLEKIHLIVKVLKIKTSDILPY